MSGSYPGETRKNVSRISQLIGARVDVLLGTDILANQSMLLDWRDGSATFSRDEIQLHGRRVDAPLRLGVPCLQFSMGGSSSHHAFLDTGAKLSYMNPGAVNGTHPLGEDDDFFPTIGAFRTKVYGKEILLAGLPFSMRFGVLPELLSMSLAILGIRWLLGNEVLRGGSVLFELGKGGMTFAN